MGVAKFVVVQGRNGSRSFLCCNYCAWVLFQIFISIVSTTTWMLLHNTYDRCVLRKKSCRLLQCRHCGLVLTRSWVLALVGEPMDAASPSLPLVATSLILPKVIATSGLVQEVAHSAFIMLLG